MHKTAVPRNLQSCSTMQTGRTLLSSLLLARMSLRRFLLFIISWVLLTAGLAGSCRAIVGCHGLPL